MRGNGLTEMSEIFFKSRPDCPIFVRVACPSFGQTYRPKRTVHNRNSVRICETESNLEHMFDVRNVGFDPTRTYGGRYGQNGHISQRGQWGHLGLFTKERKNRGNGDTKVYLRKGLSVGGVSCKLVPMTTRFAVTSAPTTVASAYLPSNYWLVGQNRGGMTVIGGNDSAGWTLDAYVIPRLQSGMYHASEVSARLARKACPTFVWDCHDDPYNTLDYPRPNCRCGQC